MEVAVSLEAAPRELHAELGAVGQAGYGETQRFGEVVTAWLKKCSCLSKEKITKIQLALISYHNMQLRILAKL